MALIALTVMTAMAAALYTTGMGSVELADNHRQSTVAFHAAEGGLQMVARWLEEVSPASDEDGLVGLHEDILDQLPAGVYFNGAYPSLVDGVIVFPELAMPQGTFVSRIESIAGEPSRVKVLSTGYYGDWQRTVSVEVEVGGAKPAIFDYGLATRGPVRMTGGVFLQGTNSADEGKLYSAWTGADPALRMSGGPWITGDAYFEDDSPMFSFSGNPKVGGGGIWYGEDIEDHLHVGVGGIEFPEPDPSVFEPYATNYVSKVKSYYDKKKDKWINEFHNVRIMANSNPTIAGDVVLKGVIYIESPNRVHFSGGCQITGVVVTEDARGGNIKGNQIKFSGGTHINPPESLPDTPEFEEIRELVGTAILAPGFSLELSGGFGTMGGTVAASEFKFTGGAGGTIKGSLMCYGDPEIHMTGGAYFYFDHSDLPEIPAGFGASAELLTDWSTYQDELPSGLVTVHAFWGSSDGPG